MSSPLKTVIVSGVGSGIGGATVIALLKAGYNVALVFVVLLSLPFASMAANSANPDVVATWRGGIHSLPASVTQSGIIEDISFKDEPPEQWEQRLQDNILKPGTKAPGVIYLHGCAGPLDAASWGQLFNEFGFAFFAPNAYARPGRRNECFVENWGSRSFERTREMEYALSKVGKFDWIDQSRLVLAGFSAGGATVSLWSGSEFIAHVILGFNCFTTGGSPNAPSSIPVLNIVGANDRYSYGDGCFASGPMAKGARTVSLSGQGHSFAGAPEADAAIAKFLKACCGFQPPSMTSDLDPEPMARKLVDELGGIATMDAMFKAEEALGNGDEEGHAFWIKVHKIAMKLTGG